MLIYEEDIQENFENIVEIPDEDLEAVAGGKLIKSTLNTGTSIRKYPSARAKSIGTLKPGETVIYDGAYAWDNYSGMNYNPSTRVKWFRVRFNGTTGWVRERDVKMIKS